MNTHTAGCDRWRIDAFLSSDQAGIDDAQLVEHLDSCAACRQYMESQAAEPEAWSRATELLQPTEFDRAGSGEFSAATTGLGHVNRPIVIQNVLESLAPSDDPHRLGRLGGYEIAGVVGIGGMGVVLKAIDPALDRVVAIKVLAPHLAHSGTARRRFSREAKAAAAVLHPNVIPIHSVSSDEKIHHHSGCASEIGSCRAVQDCRGVRRLVYLRSPCRWVVLARRPRGYEFRFRGRSAAHSRRNRHSLGFSVKSWEAAECNSDGTRYRCHSRALFDPVRGE
jgi:hypothetical protein